MNSTLQQKKVSNFSPSPLSKSHRSMLKALRIPTSTAALRRRLVQDEGENIPPLTFSSYNTQAKDYPFLSSTFPPYGVKLTLTAKYHRYEKTKQNKTKKNLKQKQSLHCFENCKPSFFFLQEEKKNRHPMNISASDLRGRRGRRDTYSLAALPLKKKKKPTQTDSG